MRTVQTIQEAVSQSLIAKTTEAEVALQKATEEAKIDALSILAIQMALGKTLPAAKQQSLRLLHSESVVPGPRAEAIPQAA